MSACGTLSPQLFSNRLVPPTRQATQPPPQPPKPATAPTDDPASEIHTSITVAEAKADIDTVFRKYLTAVTHMSELTPATTAAIIGLSATALYKGLTGGSTEGIAALGVGGSALWAYNSTMVSKPRQAVYLEGAKALSCVVTVAEPYDLEPEWMTELAKRTTTAATQLEQLRAWQASNQHLLETTTDSGKLASPAATCKRPEPHCDTTTAAGSLTDQKSLEACKQDHEQWKKECPKGADTPATITRAAPALRDAFAQATDEMGRLERAITSSDRLVGSYEMAGPKLWEQSVRIQLKVSAEVLKTEPDPSAVLSTLKNLKQVAAVIAGSPLSPPQPATPTGTAGQLQGKGGKAAQPIERERPFDKDARDAIAGLQPLLKASAEARVKLDRMLARVDQRVRDMNRNFEQCEFTAPGTPALTVNPAAGEIQLALGSEQRFSVHGGSGNPSGTAKGIGSVKVGNFAPILDENNNLVWVYKVPTDKEGGKIGDKVSLQFTDASRQATHDVIITTIGSAAPATEPTPPAATAPAAGASTPAANGGNQVTKPGDEVPAQ